MPKYDVTFRAIPDGPEKMVRIVCESETRAREILGGAEGADTEILSVKEIAEPE